MKKIYLLIALLCLFSSTGLLAQQEGGTIRGVVTDAERKTPLEYATVSLFNQADSSLVTGTTTNTEGEFILNAPFGRYYALVQFLSFGSRYQENIVLTTSDPVAELGSIGLVSDAQTLSEVEVTAQKSQMQLALDKKIFNVGESLARVGGSASDILDNIPSVTVDVEGNVALRGSQNVQILIDGKPSGLVGISGAEALRSLPADIIERVEVITNPSARYQAEGVAGIINIILKKERRDGMNGSISANVGYPSNYGASVNFNYRRKWYNLFVNYGIRYYDFNSEGFQERTYFTVEDPLTDAKYIESVNLNNRQGLSNNIRFGSDFFLNEFNTLSASFLYRASTGESIEELTYRNYNINRVLLGSSIRDAIEEETEPTMEVELNYRRTFDREGQLLTATFQTSRETELEETTIRERRSGDTENIFLRQNTVTDESEESYLFQTDYTHPFGDEGRWEAGLRASLEENINDFGVNQVKDGNWVFLDSLSNSFLYKENVYAAYGILGNKPGRFSYQVGLRAEYSDINSELLESDQDNPGNRYLSLFPSTHFTYALTESSSVEWSYSRRIRRPGGRWLNPFISQEDKYSVRAGNPDLTPEFTNSVELGYLRHLSFASITSSIYYRHTTDIIERVTTTIQTDSFPVQVSMPMNLATENAYGFEMVFNADIADWWSTNTNFNFYRQIIKGGELEGFETLDLYSDTYTWNARTNMQFKILEGLSAQSSFFYRAPMERPQGRTKALYIMDAGISKDLFNKKGNLTLSVSDVLNTRRWQSITITDDFISEGEFQWRPRTFTLGFTYQLRRSNKRGDRPDREQRQEGGDGEEMDF